MEGEDDESAGGDLHSKFKALTVILCGRRTGVCVISVSDGWSEYRPCLCPIQLRLKFPHQTDTLCASHTLTLDMAAMWFTSRAFCALVHRHLEQYQHCGDDRHGNRWEISSLHASSLPPILTSTFLPHWEDIWSPTRPALCGTPPLPPSSPLFFQGEGSTQAQGFKWSATGSVF